MRNDVIDNLLAGADVQLNLAIEGLITLDARHADYALALDHAAAHLLRLKSTGLVNSGDPSIAASLQSLSSKAANAARLLDSAAALYFGHAGSRSITELGYNPEGAPDLVCAGASLRLEA